MRLRVPSLALLSGLRTRCRVSCGVGRRRGSDPALLWLWCRPVATAPIRPLAWEPPYAAGKRLEKRQKDKKKRKKAENSRMMYVDISKMLSEVVVTEYYL